METDMSEINIASDSVEARHVATSALDVTRASSAVSWPAIFAGAAGAAALSLLLVILGIGLGFSAVSPWRMEGFTATTLGFAAIAWLSFTQLAASGMGGYLAGRLRTKWLSVHTDEVYFRDTAHGFLTWAVASLLSAVVLTSVIGSMGAGVRAGTEVVAEAAGTGSIVAATAMGSAASLTAGNNGAGPNNNLIDYFVDVLFRPDVAASTEHAAPLTNQTIAESQPQNAGQPVVEPVFGSQSDDLVSQGNKPDAEMTPVPTNEVTRIFARALQTNTLPQADKTYIGQLIAERTQLSQPEAEQRVEKSFADIQLIVKKAETTALEVADKARKASAYAALWISVTLLIGAFVASLMAVFGGRQRDAVIAGN